MEIDPLHTSFYGCKDYILNNELVENLPIQIGMMNGAYFKRRLAASRHSATRLLYPGLLVKACFRPENANNIL